MAARDFTTRGWQASVCVLLLLCGTAFAAQGIARISEFSGEVTVQRGEDLLRPVRVGKMIRNGVLMDNDMVQTKKGRATILFDDGSMLKLYDETLIVVNPPPTEQIKTVAGAEKTDRRIRIVVGKVWNLIQPKTKKTTLFELPDGVAAVRGCSSTFQVTWAGSYRLIVDTGTYLPTQFSSGLSWEQPAGCDVRVERTPGGIRIVNMSGSEHPITITLADGTKKTLKPGENFFVPIKKGTVQLASMAPFPYYKSHRFGWRTAVSTWQPGLGFVTQPMYVRDFRRNPQWRNNLASRSIFNRTLNGGRTRHGGPVSRGSGSGGPAQEITGPSESIGFRTRGR